MGAKTWNLWKDSAPILFLPPPQPTKGETMSFWEFADRNEATFFGSVALICITLISLIFASCDRHNTRVYAQNGYQQVQKQGTTDTMWVKK
jgi:hypothetical protein